MCWHLEKKQSHFLRKGTKPKKRRPTFRFLLLIPSKMKRSPGSNNSEKIEFFEKSWLCPSERDAFEAQNIGNNLTSLPAHSADQASPLDYSESEEEKAFSISQVSSNWRKKLQKHPIFHEKKVCEKMSLWRLIISSKKSLNNLEASWNYNKNKNKNRKLLLDLWLCMGMVETGNWAGYHLWHLLYPLDFFWHTFEPFYGRWVS